MISPNFLMTNQHVLKTADDATNAEYSFNHELLTDGSQSPTHVATRRKDGLFVSYQSPDKSLDYAIVELDNLPNFGSPLKLSAYFPQVA